MLVLRSAFDCGMHSHRFYVQLSSPIDQTLKRLLTIGLEDIVESEQQDLGRPGYQQ
jgi:hypothetical protein